MPDGIVQWFNPHKGFGFIRPETGRGPDIFVHYTRIAGSGYRVLEANQYVEYTVSRINGRVEAIDVRVLS
nr:cold shock domain-containing protein [Nocardia transvalensis]